MHAFNEKKTKKTRAMEGMWAWQRTGASYQPTAAICSMTKYSSYKESEQQPCFEKKACEYVATLYSACELYVLHTTAEFG